MPHGETRHSFPPVRRHGLVLVAVVALSSAVAFSSPAGGQVNRDVRRGLIYDGLRQRAGGPCGSGFEIVAGTTGSRVRCTHGPDPAPDGVDVRQRREAPSSVAGAEGAHAAAQAGIPCVGTGSDGYRVQLLYARRSGTTNRLDLLYPSFVGWAAAADLVFDASAARTGGARHLRFVTDSNCDLVITAVTVSSAAIANFATFIDALQAQGFNRPDRRYLAWTDANVYCGIGEVYGDDNPNAVPGLPSSNANNGNPLVAGSFGRVDNACWGQFESVEAHELVHTMGGVQESAPNATEGMHCTDESDLMCYLDGTPPGTVAQLCNGPADGNRLDCNNDDYFHTGPPPASYLATHWNVANSAFLSAADPPGPVVVAIAGSGTTQSVMRSLADTFDGSVVQIDGAPTTVRVFNIPSLP